jgi:hypothetical protein
MDLSHGKYDGPLAALAEYWLMAGDQGTSSHTNEVDGSGEILYKLEPPTHLSWHEARQLMADHDAEVEDLDQLDALLLNAGGVFYAWDSQGFQAAHTLSSAEAERTDAALIERNRLEWEDEFSQDEIVFTPSDPDGGEE